MNRNQIIVLVSQMGETGMKTRRVISMIPLGKGKKVRVVGHSCQVSTMSKGQSGRKKHATEKAACVAHGMYLSDSIKVAVVTTGIGRKKKRRILILLPGIHCYIVSVSAFTYCHKKGGCVKSQILAQPIIN